MNTNRKYIIAFIAIAVVILAGVIAFAPHPSNEAPVTPNLTWQSTISDISKWTFLSDPTSKSKTTRLKSEGKGGLAEQGQLFK